MEEKTAENHSDRQTINVIDAEPVGLRGERSPSCTMATEE
jgi:hypothetical protein